MSRYVKFIQACHQFSGGVQGSSKSSEFRAETICCQDTSRMPGCNKQLTNYDGYSGYRSSSQEKKTCFLSMANLLRNHHHFMSHGPVHGSWGQTRQVTAKDELESITPRWNSSCKRSILSQCLGKSQLAHSGACFFGGPSHIPEPMLLDGSNGSSMLGPTGCVAWCSKPWWRYRLPSWPRLAVFMKQHMGPERRQTWNVAFKMMSGWKM